MSKLFALEMPLCQEEEKGNRLQKPTKSDTLGVVYGKKIKLVEFYCVSDIQLTL